MGVFNNCPAATGLGHFANVLAVLENIAIMLLTIVVLLAGGYLALVLLNWGLKLKSGGREENGLLDLWAEAQKESKSTENSDPSTKDQ